MPFKRALVDTTESVRGFRAGYGLRVRTKRDDMPDGTVPSLGILPRAVWDVFDDHFSERA